MTYVITGGSKGIGKCTAQILRAQGHRVIDISLHDPDILADIGTAEGREEAISRVHELCPEGIDGLISNAAIPGGLDGQTPGRVLSVNYFGSLAVIQGLYDLLEKKQGNCVVTVSGSVAYGKRTRYDLDDLLTNCGDEERICAFAGELAQKGLPVNAYVTTKYALCRWVKRVSASWAVRGVIINAVAPGGVDTTIIPGMKTNPLFDTITMAFPMPTVYAQRDLMRPETIAGTLAFMVSPAARGSCGTIVYCDGGSSAILHSEIYI